MKRFRISPNVDQELAIDHYRKLAKDYDASCMLIEPIRQKAIAMLDLKRGEIVLDVASGTGKSIVPMSRAVGSDGCIVAIEQSPDMAAISEARVIQHSLQNVIHIIAPAEQAVINKRADAALFHYTHDVFRSPAALANIMSALRPGARIVVAGYKSARGLRAVFNPWFRFRARGYLSTFEGIDAPWNHLLSYTPDFVIESEYFLGSGYIGTASMPVVRVVSLPLKQGTSA